MYSSKFALAVLLTALWALPTSAQTPCRAPESSVRLALPGRPYAAVASPDGCSIYVSIQNPPNPSLALVAFEGGMYVVKNSAPLTIQPAGLALTHDGKLVIAPGVDGVAFVDTARLASGIGNPVLGSLDDGGRGAIQAAVTADDQFLFVSDERSNTITVIDLAKARATGFKPDSIIGKIPTGTQPVGMKISPDQRFLYGAIEVAKEGSTGVSTCAEVARGGQASAIPEGVLMVVDVAKAKTSPETSVIANLPSGCRPVRVVLSKDGSRAYVAARGSNEIVGFDTAAARSNPRTARLGSVKLPTPAIGLALTSDESTLIAANGQTLTLIDPAKIHLGSASIKGTIPSSGPGRELFITQDNTTLLLTNNAASLLEIFDLTRLPK
jgi:DNA-binding beta-propeller fold protein YncE